MRFGSWFGHVLELECSAEPLDNCELGCSDPWKMVVSQLTILSPMFDCGEVRTKASALEEQVAVALTCVATKMTERLGGGRDGYSEHTEVLKKENDRLQSLDSQLNAWSERQSFCGDPKRISYSSGLTLLKFRTNLTFAGFRIIT